MKGVIYLYILLIECSSC